MNRYYFLDRLRGITVVSMVAYHGIWDLVHIFHINISWFNDVIGYIWQQSICYTFILLSGFCWSLGTHQWKRGITILICGAVISVITAIFLPDGRIIFGILTFLGFAVLVMIGLERLLKKVPAITGMGSSLVLFLITRNVNRGSLGFERLQLMKFPRHLYCNYISAFFGFPQSTFFSADYFSVIPWIFLFIAGYYIYQIFKQKEWNRYLVNRKWRWLEWIGQHSLGIYMLHQPAILGCISLFQNF